MRMRFLGPSGVHNREVPLHTYTCMYKLCVHTLSHSLCSHMIHMYMYVHLHICHTHKIHTVYMNCVFVCLLANELNFTHFLFTA